MYFVSVIVIVLCDFWTEWLVLLHYEDSFVLRSLSQTLNSRVKKEEHGEFQMH